MQAIKCGGRFVKVFLSTAPFWHALHDIDEDGVRRFGGVAKDVQKAARVMQILCSDAKTKKDASLVAKVWCNCIATACSNTLSSDSRMEALPLFL